MAKRPGESPDHRGGTAHIRKAAPPPVVLDERTTWAWVADCNKSDHEIKRGQVEEEEPEEGRWRKRRRTSTSMTTIALSR